MDNSNPKKAKNVQLQTPIRIRVRKSPVLVHFDMHKVAVSLTYMLILNSMQNNMLNAKIFFANKF